MKLPSEISKQVVAQSSGGFAGNTLDNPRNESCNAIGLRSRVVPSGEVEKEGGVEKNERLAEEKGENGNKGNTEGEVEKIEKLIDAESMLRKNQSPTSQGTWERAALEQMPIYAKFMKDLLSGKRKLRDDENVALSEECSAILQRMLPPKLKDPGSFTIPCSNGKVKVKRALCDLGASINSMHLSMVRKLDCGEPKLTKMTLTLVDRSITYPYGVLEDVPFLATGRALIDVELGELMLSFQNEQVTFNVFESMSHQNENPQCCRVGVVEELEEEIAQDEPPIRSIEKVNVLVEENKKKGGSMKQVKAPTETPKTPLKKKRKKMEEQMGEV
ncbi:uncharacterized protein LOC123896356 [Trifolium pratense]|uniref:uncharacterized protein LOC123896356 n=1 Tax=Trifolium pratense TaxID=57577 RepID=UPI001E697509|nr:uncharacterized protein LOC123896356 [Trifolium pratense]